MTNRRKEAGRKLFHQPLLVFRVLHSNRGKKRAPSVVVTDNHWPVPCNNRPILAIRSTLKLFFPASFSVRH